MENVSITSVDLRHTVLVLRSGLLSINRTNPSWGGLGKCSRYVSARPDRNDQCDAHGVGHYEIGGLGYSETGKWGLTSA